MNDTEQFATYSPEDNKLRLYIGRVPREEFLKLRSEGWVTLHKQREAGGGDFVATWTPERRATALQYSDGIIYDEDMGPEERAADRAERFSGYRDKRTDEAVGHADHYDSQPAAHGYQSQARAERAAARHDRIGGRAVDAWDKAEYWQRRTAGVISHALHKSSPGVRMGRIKELEAALRKHAAVVDKQAAIYRAFVKLAAIEDKEKQNRLVLHFVGNTVHLWAEYMHPRAAERTDRYKDNETSLYSLMKCEHDPITGAEACELYLSDHSTPAEDDDWSTHYKLRLAYENQMLEAQGGRAAFVEMEVGGWIGGYQIRKVNRSNATGRVVSVGVLDPKGWSGFTKESGYKEHVTRPAVVVINIERLSTNSYRPPTEEDKKKLAETIKAEKAKAPKKETIPLINPTEEEAERLQKIWNERALADHCERYKKEYGRDYASEFKPATICRITQAVYSANSKGVCARAETRGLKADAMRARRFTGMYSDGGDAYDKRTGPAVCTIRITGTDGSTYAPPRVIVLTDKPQKPLPKAVWEPLKVKATAEKPETVNA